MHRSTPRGGGSGPLTVTSGGMAAAWQANALQQEARVARGQVASREDDHNSGARGSSGGGASGDLTKTVTTTGDELESMVT